MTISLYSTVELIRALDAMDRPTAWLRDTMFGNIVTSDAEEIAIDRLLKRKKMAPFVSPDVPAKERALRGRKVETFKPAYVKPLNTIRPNDLVKRAHGEPIGGTMSLADRRPQIINQTLLDQDDEITRREEWMCAQILKTGSVTVSGEDYETQVVDFQRPAGHSMALTTTDRWGETGVDPLKTIRTLATTVQKGSGAVVTQVIMGAEAAELFQNDEKVQKIMENRRSSDTAAFRLTQDAAGAQGSPAAYLGSIGQFDYWTYSQWFEDDAGNEIELWPTYGVGLMAPNGFAGNMAYGAILDMESLASVSRFPSNYTEKNPSRELLMTQSAPLPVPSDITASAFMTVR